jgi:hypothetical protein
MASQADIELGVVKVSFLHPSTVEFGCAVNAMGQFFTDVPVDTAVTPA